jgi:hypothetical protein
MQFPALQHALLVYWLRIICVEHPERMKNCACATACGMWLLAVG